MKFLFLIFILTFTFSTFKADDEGYFSVVGSQLLRPNKPYQVAINYQGFTVEKTIQVGIKSGSSYEEKKEITLNGNGFQNIEFIVNNQLTGEYELEVKSVTGKNFESSRKIQISKKQFSVFIQTDKAMYKPADKIQYRVFLLDAETRPFKAQKVEIFITDGENNRVKQLSDVKFNTGVFESELKLSDLPIMGNWKINVKVNDQKEVSKTFEVAEYVLPKFELLIDTKTDACFKDEKITATVKAKYTFGKIAKGNATITAEVEKFWNENVNKVSKSIDVNGKKHVEFDIEKELGLSDKSRERTVNLHAKFMEELTGKEQEASAKIKIHKTPHKVQIENDKKFKPGLPFKVDTSVLLHDKSTPVTDDRNPVNFIITYHSNNEHLTKRDQVYPKNGNADLNLIIPANTTSLDIKATYIDTTVESVRISKANSESNEYIQAKLLTRNPLITQKVSIKVLSTKELKTLSYQIIASGSIVDSKTISISNKKQMVLQFSPKAVMLPTAYVVIYYMASNGEVISDKVIVNFKEELRNSIDISLSSNQTKPGENVDIQISSQLNSFVGILGVDQSVLILKKGNDIEHSEVFQDLKKYHEVEQKNDYWFGMFDDIFKETGTVMISNSMYDQRRLIELKIMLMREREMMFMREMEQERRGFDMVLKMEIERREQQEVVRHQISPIIKTTTKPPEPIIPSKPIEIRKVFPETWLFESFNFDQSSKVLSRKVPDTITSWIITGFSVNPQSGLGLTKEATTLNVFQPFFVSTNLPYSVKRGEIISIPIVVFNYMNSDQEVEVTFFNADKEFEFVEANEAKNDVNQRKRRSLDAQRMKRIFVKSNEGTSVSFMVRPLKVGRITIKVTAASQIAGDGVEERLLVEPEGITQFLNEAILLNLKNSEEFQSSIDITIPENAIEDSTRIEASISGDVMGPTIENLHKLIKLPYGCGEQNMLNFVPNIVVLDYLTSVNKLTPDIEKKAKNFLESGYQRQLTYKHNDGSYSAFGKSDKSGSTWLTAFVAKSFNQARKYTNIDENVINETLSFLSKVQASDGSFPEVGHMLSKAMQGGASKGIALTSYTLITFLENEKFTSNYKSTIDKALNYILMNFDSIDDNYSLAIAAYALQLSNHETKNVIFHKLTGKSENKDGMKFWKREDATSDGNRPDSINIEMTSYALLAFLAANREIEAISIMKWLVTQRNENGGFQSTQDTIVGLQSLAKLAATIHASNTNVRVSLNADAGNKIDMIVNEGNSLILQKYEVSSAARHFEVSATGSGISLLQISYRFNIDDPLKFPRFILTPTVLSSSNKEFLHLKVCTNFVADVSSSISNMAVMEVALPSGFTYDNEHIPVLKSSPRVKRVETKEGDTLVIIYFDDIDTNEICPEIEAYRTHDVAEQKPSPIIIYDYYDNSRQARKFYNPPEISLCDICAGDDECRDVCEVSVIEID